MPKSVSGQSLRTFVYIPVQNAESKVEDEEDHQIMPDQLKDTALPPEQEVPYAVEPVGRVLVHVGVDAGVQLLPLSPHVDRSPHRNCCKTEKLFSVPLVSKKY